MKKKPLFIYFIIIQFFICSLLLSTLGPIITSSSPFNNYDLKSSWVNFSNITIISDGYGGSYWNYESSIIPEIAVDNNNVIHVVWQDQTNGAWGIDTEIMYAQYTIATGWSNATVISDGYNSSYWNDGYSDNPKIAINNNQVCVIWDDNTDGVWGTDKEIMFISFEISVPPTCINPSGGIPFSNFFFLFKAASILGLIVHKKRKL